MGYRCTFLQFGYEFSPPIQKTDKVYIDYTFLKKTFSVEENIIILGVNRNRLYESKAIYNRWINLQNDIKNIKTISGKNIVINVFSETSIPFFMLDDSLKKIRHTPSSEYLNNINGNLDSLKTLVSNTLFYEYLLFSNNASTSISLMLVFLEDSIFNSPDRKNFIHNIETLISSFEKESTEQIYVTGIPYLRDSFVKLLKEEMNLFIALSLILTLCVLFILFKSLYFVLVNLVLVLFGIASVLGMISLFGYPVSGLMILIPPLIIIISVPNTVYFLNKFLHYLNKDKVSKSIAIQLTIQSIAKPTFITNLTTAIGFSSFIFTPSLPLLHFGIISSINIIMVFLLSITIIPLLLSIKSFEKKKYITHFNKIWIRKLIVFLTVKAYTKSGYLYAVISIILGISFYGIHQIKKQGQLLDDVPNGNILREDLNVIQEQFDGFIPLEIIIESNGNGSLFKLKNLKKIEHIHDFLEQKLGISNSLSITNGLKYVNQIFYNNDPSYYNLPHRNDMVYLQDYFNNSSLDSLAVFPMYTFIDSTKKKLRISLRVTDLTTKEMNQLVTKIKRGVDSILNPNKAPLNSLTKKIIANNGDKDSIDELLKKSYGRIYRKIQREPKGSNWKDTYIANIKQTFFNIRVTGLSVYISRGIEFLIDSVFISLLFSFVFIFCVILFIFRSIRTSFIAIIPNLLPLIVVAGIMGFLGLNITVSTALIFGISFGIAVDDAIHFLTKFQQNIKLYEKEIAIKVTISETAISMLYTSIILYVGFFIFIFSDFGGTYALGLLTSTTLLIAMLTNLLLLPAILMKFYRKKLKSVR